jgi:hypothetical protein
MAPSRDAPGVVEVDRLLDEAQAEDSEVEVDVALGVVGHGGDVVQPEGRNLRGARLPALVSGQIRKKSE